MSDSNQERTNESVHGLVQLAHPGLDGAESATIDLPEAYQPCEGTWKEFTGDTKRFLGRISDGLKDFWNDSSESVRKTLRREKTREV